VKPAVWSSYDSDSKKKKGTLHDHQKVLCEEQIDASELLSHIIEIQRVNPCDVQPRFVLGTPDAHFPVEQPCVQKTYKT
jgi:hypothetical protein